MTIIGIDVFKGKGTVCTLKPYGEVVASPYKILHTEPEISALVSRIQTKSETNCGGSHRCLLSSAGFPLQRDRIFCEHHQFTDGKNMSQ